MRDCVFQPVKGTLGPARKLSVDAKREGDRVIVLRLGNQSSNVLGILLFILS